MCVNITVSGYGFFFEPSSVNSLNSIHLIKWKVDLRCVVVKCLCALTVKRNQDVIKPAAKFYMAGKDLSPQLILNILMFS